MPRRLLPQLAVAAATAVQLGSGQELPPECAPGTDGIGMFDTGQITYSAANMPAVESQLIDDPHGRRAEMVIDCRWLLRCSDDAHVPQVTFTTFATENNHDYVRLWDGTPIGQPTVHRIADLHGSRLPDPVVGFGNAMTVQFVSDATDDRWSRGDHFTASFGCVEADPNALHPYETLRCTMEYHELVGYPESITSVDGISQLSAPGSPFTDVMDLDADCGSRHAGSHLASIHSPGDQEHFESLVQANGARSVWIGLNDIDSESRCAGMDFVWTDGTPFDYENWSAGEPNNWPVNSCQHWVPDRGEDCVEAWRQGQSWSDAGCANHGPVGYICSYDCDPLPPPPPPALPCTSAAGLTARVSGLTETCCPDGSCTSSLPRFCDVSCSLGVLAFSADCQDYFGVAELAQVIAPVLEVCEATAGDADPTEVGGDQLDKFWIDNLIGCSNLAHGRPATQSSTAYGGDASKAVDGNGLDGSWGSASCSHTGEDEAVAAPPPCSLGRVEEPGWHQGESEAQFRLRCHVTDGNDGPRPSPPLPPSPPVGAWWQVDLGSVQDIRAVQLVNRQDCCQDRLVGARIVVSQTSDYESSRPGDIISCGSVDEAESPIDEQEVIIKACEPNTTGRYVTVVGPNRIYPDPDNLYLTLCEVAVYGNCPALSDEAMAGTMSAAEAQAAESLGENCHISLGPEALSFADAEHKCNQDGGHLASIHNEEEAEYARRLIANSPWARQGEAWIGLNDRKVECSCHSSCFVWTDGTPNDFLTSWRPTEPDDGHGPGECAPKPGTPTPCHDDDAALWALGLPHDVHCVGSWGSPGFDAPGNCPVPDGARPDAPDGTPTNCGFFDPDFRRNRPGYPPIMCSQYLDNPACTCSCPPPAEDCTAIKNVLTAPDIGWVDTICELRKPYLCRSCARPHKNGDDGDGH